MDLQAARHTERLDEEDPDGFRVVLVPERWAPAITGEIRIEEYTGSRAELRPLFELRDRVWLDLPLTPALG